MLQLQSVASKWQVLGIEFGVSPDLLAGSTGEARFNPAVCLEKMLRTRLAQPNPPATLEGLLRALASETVGEKLLASHLYSKFFNHATF